MIIDLLIKGLAHEDFFVRSRCLSVAFRRFDLPIDATKAVMRTIDSYGWNDSYEHTFLLNDFPQDTESLVWALEKCVNNDSTLSANAQSWLWRWMSKAPSEHLHDVIEKMDECKVDRLGQQPDIYRFETSFAVAQLRNNLSHLDLEKCLELAESDLQKCAKSKEYPSKKVYRLELIAERLATDAQQLKSDIEQWVSIDPDTETILEQYRCGFGVMLAGYTKYPAVTDKLIKLYEYDWDWWNDEVQNAFKRIGTPAMQQIFNQYPGLDWHARLFLSEVMEDVTPEGYEQQMVDLIDSEPDDDLRVKLGFALATYCTQSAMAKARKIYYEHTEDPEREDIANLLYAIQSARGEDSPEMQRWRIKMEEIYNYRKKAEKKLLPFVQHTNFGKSSSVDKKIGRNDPCPCGSGKKYKKCCLLKG